MVVEAGKTSEAALKHALGRIDTSTTPDTYGIPCGMNGGSSGGG